MPNSTDTHRPVQSETLGNPSLAGAAARLEFAAQAVQVPETAVQEPQRPVPSPMLQPMPLAPAAGSSVAPASTLGIKVSNEEFLQAIFGEYWHYAHVTAFPSPPDLNTGTKDDRYRWAGGWFKDCLPDVVAAQNSFYTISLFRPATDQNGKPRAVRQKDLHHSTCVIVIDDVGTGPSAKVAPERVAELGLPEPSYRLETSPQNEQWGYLLDKPCTNRGLVENLLNTLVKLKLCPDGKDPGIKGVTRYVRLPEGVNNKTKYHAEHPDGWRHRLNEWAPERRYCIEDLARCIGADTNVVDIRAVAGGSAEDQLHDALNDWPADPVLDALDDLELIQSWKQPGQAFVICPNAAMHTDERDDGALYYRVGVSGREHGGYMCHHGHCSEALKRTDLVPLLVDEYKAQDKAVPEALRRAGEWSGLTIGDGLTSRQGASDAPGAFDTIKAALTAEAESLNGQKLPPGSADQYCSDIARAALSEAQIADLKALLVRHSNLDGRGVIRAVRAAERVNGDNREPSHRDVAERYIIALEKNAGVRPVATEGEVFLCDAGVWKGKPFDEIADDVSAAYRGLQCMKKDGDYKGVANCVYRQCKDEAFFESAPEGAATAGWFLRLSPDGEILVEKLVAEHRQRFVLPVAPDYSPPVQWLEFLSTTFAGVEQTEQISLLQEIFGAVVFGLMPSHQKAVLLYGESNAGKSLVHVVMEGLVPKESRACVSPYSWGEKTSVALLAGKRLNLVGELEQNKGMPAGAFKSVTGKDSIPARKLYKDGFDFKNSAAHIFNSNYYPPCGDRGRSFFRRWLILHFRNPVNEADVILDLGEHIVAAEMPQILGWAIQGAQRLKVCGFTVTETHRALLAGWKRENSSVASFLMDREYVRTSSGVSVTLARLYERYRDWCVDNGRTKIGKQHFLAEARLVLAREFSVRESRLSDNNYFIGVYVDFVPAGGGIQSCV